MPSERSPEEIARGIMEACCLSRDGIEPMVVEAIREAEIRGASWGIDAARAAHNAAKGACESRDCCEGITTIALRSLDPAAISAERSAGPSDGGKDRKATGELSDAPKPAPACARCGGAEVLPCPHLREECQRLRHEAKHEPCPECRGKP